MSSVQKPLLLIHSHLYVIAGIQKKQMASVDFIKGRAEIRLDMEMNLGIGEFFLW